METTTLILFTLAFFAPMALVTVLHLLTERAGGYLGGEPGMPPVIPARPPERADARVDGAPPAMAAANDDAARAAA